MTSQRVFLLYATLLQEAVPGLAVSRYEELFRRLVAECPEFGIWVSMFDWQAPRAELRNGLAGLGQLLDSITCGRLPDQRRAALARAYQVALAKPIAPSGEVPAELQIPALGQGYIDHRIRVAEVTASSDPGRDSWWNDVPVRDDACGFLAGFLTSPAAQESPLILLGQPGSGKSVVTRVLAARLPVADFLPVRVELRQVPAEADLQEQIEFAVRDARDRDPTATTSPSGCRARSRAKAWAMPPVARIPQRTGRSSVGVIRLLLIRAGARPRTAGSSARGGSRSRRTGRRPRRRCCCCWWWCCCRSTGRHR